MNATSFFVIMCVLNAVDAITTYRGLKGGAREANGVLRALMKEFGVRETLLVVKTATLVWLWFYPVTDLLSQAALIVIYLASAINNIVIIKRIR